MPTRARHAPAVHPARPSQPRTRPRGGPQRSAAAAATDVASPDRILAAALAEFAAHGFAGARVDRVARTARVNKAMLYYHFGSKAGLYRAAIQRMLGSLVERLEAIALAPGPAADKLDRFILTFVETGTDEPSVAPIMLREVVEGASRLDRDTFLLLARIVSTMSTIVRQGQQDGAFRDVNPLLTYLTTVWPIMVYLASGPIRASIARHTGIDTAVLDSSSFVRHMQQMSRQALALSVTTAAPLAPPEPSTPTLSPSMRRHGQRTFAPSGLSAERTEKD